MNYAAVLDQVEYLAQNPVTLVVVSKGHSWVEMEPAYVAGCRDFAENRLPEAFEKQSEAPADIRWHYIGPLQKNKVKKAIGRFHLIHSVDTLELAEKIAECSFAAGITTAILLQVNTSGEATKQGLNPQDWKESYGAVQALPGLRIEGLMTMAPLTEDFPRIQRCFHDLRLLREVLTPMTHPPHSLHHLSMGMSHDFPIALREGATLLRLGTVIFK